MEIEVMGNRHRLRLCASSADEGNWNAKMLDESKTVIQRFEADKIGYGFLQVANFLLSCGKIIRISSLSEDSSYSTLLMQSIIQKERKSKNATREYLLI